MKKVNKLLCFIFVFVLTLCSINSFSAFAASSRGYTVTYDGNTKIISNIQQNTFQASPTAKSVSSEDVNALLKEIGYDEEQISHLSESEINDYLSAKKIYAVSGEKTFYEEVPVTRSSVGSPVTVNNSKMKIVFTVTENSSRINGKKAFKLKTTVDWKKVPTWRLKDMIAIAWTDGALTCGSSRSHHSMTYDRALWSNGSLIESKNDMAAPSSSHYETNTFPNYGVLYDLPGDSLVPQYLYSDFYMSADTMVTATKDFAACSSYGHQTVGGTPSADVSKSGLSVSITFGIATDDYYTGSIRVYL